MSVIGYGPVNPAIVPQASKYSLFQVTFCLRSIWSSRNFETYTDAINFIERMQEKHKRIDFLSLIETFVFVDKFNKGG